MNYSQSLLKVIKENMIDFDRLEKLHTLTNLPEDTPERIKAREVVAEIQDDVLARYLSLPENCRHDKAIYPDFGVLWARVLLDSPEVVTPPDYDVIGTILTHWKHIASRRKEENYA